MATAKQSESKPLNIDKYIAEPPRNRIYRIGIELEGAWKVVPPDSHVDHDGSVDRTLGGGNGLGGAVKLGEIKSEPIMPIKVESWIRKHYPQFVNATCGLHVHMSFLSAAHYGQLMVPEFTETVFFYFDKWAKDNNLGKDHPIWQRLTGKNEYCQKKFYAEQQAVRPNRGNGNHFEEGSRYTAVNYAYECHKTMECRLLPMMDTAELSIKAVRHLLNITNASLVVLAKREEEVKGKVTVSERGYVEQHRRKIF